MRKSYLLLLLLLTSYLSAELTQEQQQQLIEKFGPLLILHEDELSFPSSVKWYLKRSSLKKRDGDKSTLVTPKGEVTTEQLGNLPDMGRYYFLKPDPKEVKKIYRGQPIIGAKQERTKLIGGTSSSECYANVVERKDGRIVIQFMFFYPYQGTLLAVPGIAKKVLNMVKKLVPLDKIGMHVSDWEHTDVYLKKIGSTGNITDDYVLDQVFYGRHQQRKGDLLYKKDVPLANDDMKKDKTGTHPIVYVAKHSHAGYPKVVILSGDVDTTSDKGPRWPTWKSAKPVGTLDNPLPGMEWIKALKLRWGNTTAESIKIPLIGKIIEYHGNSPTPPTEGGWYAKPGIEKKSIETRISGKRVDYISAGPEVKDKKEKRYSAYFDIEIPGRIRKLEWQIEHIDKDKIIFDVYEHKKLLSPKLIYKGIKDSASKVKVPSSRTIKNLFIANLRRVDGKELENPVKVSIWGIEE